MKTQLKIAKQRSRIPVLKTVLVKNGMMTTTDLDIYITGPAPENMDDGLYFPDGFETLGLKTDLDIKDYPPLYNLKGFQGIVTLTAEWILDHFYFVSRAMSDEEARYYLNGICFKGHDMVSTDGHRLHLVKMPESWPVNEAFKSGVILPKNAVKYVLDMVKEKKPESVNLEFFSNGFKFTIGDTILISKLVDGNFPDYERAIPALGGVQHEFDPALLADHIFKTVKTLAKVNKTRHVNIKFNDNGHIETKFAGENRTFPMAYEVPYEIGFNLGFLVDACAGVMSYSKDSYGPVRIDALDRLAVIMPVRV